jgi:hypothetical protein
MKKGLLPFFTILFFLHAQGQSDSIKWVKEINEQVWKPFVASLTSGNNEDFKALHSKRITRVLVDNNLIQDFQKYFPAGSKKSNDSTIKFLFELRFDKRIANGTKAWETGYFKGTVLQTGKETRTYYGRFLVVLEKENGVWKIIVDADTRKDATEENFRAASPME